VEPVQFTRPLSDVKISRLGEPATFECEVTKPEVRAQWLKDGFDLQQGPKYDIGVTGSRYRLTVRDVDDRDAGDYAIVVKGHRSEARLEVESRPEFKVGGISGDRGGGIPLASKVKEVGESLDKGVGG